MNNNVIILNGSVHLTTSGGINERTEARLEEYYCRILIEKLTKAIPKTTLDINKQEKYERLDFCTNKLDEILEICYENASHGKLLSKINELYPRMRSIMNDSIDFKQVIIELEYKIRRSQQHIATLDEALSIAEKIFQDKRDTPFEIPTSENSNKNIISVCCICREKKRRRKIRCRRCASVFHHSCHRNRSECPACLAGITPIDIVLKATATRTKKWWPALVVQNHQVPNDIYRKRKNQPGSVFVFVFGICEYEQVPARDLLAYQIDDEYRQYLLTDNKNAKLKTAIKIAENL